MLNMAAVVNVPTTIAYISTTTDTTTTMLSLITATTI